MAVFGWIIFTLLTAYVVFAVGLASLFHCSSGSNPPGVMLVGLLVAAFMAYIVYTTCPFTVSLS